MIPWGFLWIMTLTSSVSANNLGRYDDDYGPENGYLRAGKRYSANMHSYQAGGAYNERYADNDRYIARNLQKAPDYRRDDDDDDRDGRSGAYNGERNWMGQHYPVKNTYIKPTPSSSTTCPAFTTPSCVTVTSTTTLSRLVSICQLPTNFAFQGDAELDTVVTAAPVTGTCTLVALPRKLVPDCCSDASTASSYVPCFTTTFVRTILRDKTCTLNVESTVIQDAYFGIDGMLTAVAGVTFFYVNVASTCAL